MFITTWALQHAIELNPGGIKEPIQMAIMKKNDRQRFSANFVNNDEILEHLDNIADAESYLADYKSKQQYKERTQAIPEKELK